jgi:cytochrome bd ubiquinol oxidase subunit II
VSAEVVALILLLAMTAYACGGGTDYGAGFWDLTAGNLDRGTRPRALIDYAMAPVWEANNVWLVFVLVVTWTGFPTLLQAVFSTTWIALVLGVLGLVLRGVGFAFRKPSRRLAQQRRYGALFGVASLLTPFFFAAAVGGAASGRVSPGQGGDPITSWLNPTSVVFGAFAVAAAAFISAVFLTQDARRFDVPDLVEHFRRRSLGAAVALLVVGVVALAVLSFDARYVYEGLLRGWGLAFVLVAVIATVLTAVLVGRRIQRGVRVTAVMAVGSVVLAWGLAQRPYLLPTTLTITQAAGNADTLLWLMIMTLIAVVLVVPTLWLLYRLDTKGELVAEHGDDI